MYPGAELGDGAGGREGHRPVKATGSILWGTVRTPGRWYPQHVSQDDHVCIFSLPGSKGIDRLGSSDVGRGGEGHGEEVTATM